MSRKPTKYVFVTGGVVSSIGKGLASASVGALLEARGLRVTHLKLDEGIYHYKFVVNGDTWMQDPKSDPA